MKIDICIRGAGVVGQVLALLLARGRINVRLLQSPPGKQPDLRSFALNAASRQVLMDLRVWPEKATPVNRMQVFGDGAGQINFDAKDQPLAWIVDAVDLHQQLAAAIKFATEIELQPHQNSSLDSSDAQLTVICEGRISQTRQATGATYEQYAYQQSAIAAQIQCEKPHEMTAKQWMQSDQICALLPRGASQRGNSMSLVWSVAHEQSQTLLKKSPDQFLEALRLSTRDSFGQLDLASRLTHWPLMLAQAHQWCGQASWGAWVLVGDAAHAIHPLAGQGLNLGLGDAVELAQVLAGKPYFKNYADLKLLRSYERARKGDAAMLRLATDGLQRLFSSNDTTMLNLRNWGMQGFEAATPVKTWLMQRAAGMR